MSDKNEYKPKIEIINENLTEYKIAKEFEIEVELESGDFVELTFNKWTYENDNNIDNDWEFDDESKKIYDDLPKELQDKISDFISDTHLSETIEA